MVQYPVSLEKGIYMKKRILILSMLSLNMSTLSVVPAGLILNAMPQTVYVASKATVLAEREFSLENRYHVKSVSDVFRDNILLNLAYLSGRVTSADNINWSEVTKPQTYKFTLKPNETFAYHKIILPQYEGKIALTANATFGKNDGFKTDGLLYGDGVCHLASLISWAAKDAKLEVYAPANHDFAAIPEVPKSEGVSIYYDPNNRSRSIGQNLYITNNQAKPVDFNFTYEGGILKVSVSVQS